MVNYSTNWMGPINQQWIEEHGDCWSAGRIDIYGVPGEDYPIEYGLPIMHTEDWNALSDFLWDLTTPEKLSYDELVYMFEYEYGKKIRWWKNDNAD